MTGDPEGHYAQLGVSPGASAAEIKVAYRRLVKLYHPDRNPSAAARLKFQAVTEAYRILNDSAQRRVYDSPGYTGAANQYTATVLDPISCSRCHRVTAQPRRAAFRRVVGILVTTKRVPVEGIFCASCARKTALRESLISAVAGWWALPWGPVFTVREIVRNALGGEQDTEAADWLLWHNAQAFYSQGNRTVAYALAEKVSHGTDADLSLLAARLISELRAQGVPHRLPALKNPWCSSPLRVGAHLALLCAVPILIGGWVFQDALIALWAETPALLHHSQAAGAHSKPPL